MQSGRPQERQRKGEYSPTVLYNISRAFEIDLVLEKGPSFDCHATLLLGLFLPLGTSKLISLGSSFFLYFVIIIYLFWLLWSLWRYGGFSGCSTRASLVAELRSRVSGLSSCGVWTWLPCSMGDLSFLNVH